MIPQAFIDEWQQLVPWKLKEQVENDNKSHSYTLAINRFVLLFVCIFSIRH